MAQVKKILLLDDNYESLLPLKTVLEEFAGYAVTLTAEASLLELLPTERFDLLIVDRMIASKGINGAMQEVRNLHFEGIHWQKTGPEFVKRLRNGQFAASDGSGTAADVPVIMLSAVANGSLTPNDLDALQLVEYIEKPFDLEELLSLIAKVFQEQAT